MGWLAGNLIHLPLAFFVAQIAKDKGRDYWLWLLFGLIIPVYALFYVVLVDDLSKTPKFPRPRKRKKTAPLETRENVA
jgi:hypothetical protein